MTQPLSPDLAAAVMAISRAQEAANVLAPKIAQLQSFYARIRPTLEYLAEAAQQAHEWEARQTTIGAFAAHGLCLAPSMPPEFIEQILQRHEESRPVGPFVLGAYRRNGWAELVTMVTEWQDNGFFRRRSHIYREALWAHMNGRYTASVRTIMPEFEGLVLDWIFHFTRRDLKRVESVLKKKGSDKYSGNVVSKTIGQLAANILTREGWTSMVTLVEFANRHLYRRYRIEKEHAKFLSQTSLARHAMLHGSSLRSGTALNSLRLFLALDVLTLVE